MNKPVYTKIKDVFQETSDVKTFHFNFEKPVIPGQFFMIWIPGIDEIPMSVSFIHKDMKGISFRCVGEATDALFQLSKNDVIGVRGPYGNGFSFHGKHVLFIGGGTGIAMIAPAVEQCIEEKRTVDVILGAKTKDELFFVNRLEAAGASVHISTDDGSEGFKGFASDLAEEIIDKKQPDFVFTCGPELMMSALYNLCKERKISFQASLERYMKCAVGVCGQCCVGKGLRVCVEGPVFSTDTLDVIEDFGMFKRDASGKKEKI